MLKEKLTSGSNGYRPGYRGNLIILEEARVGSEASGDTPTLGQLSEREPSAEAVAGDNDRFGAEFGFHVVDGGGDERVSHLGAVLLEELCEVEAGRAVDVARGGRAVEHVWRHREEPGAAEAIRESDIMQESVLCVRYRDTACAAHSLFSGS